ncbi:hypothetical protein H4R34_001623 [Dimargaris verticillata]|uniref:DUF2470 domain-containing protein n=1 Tax=Dimargaris verticillata TaxID=2761393 RepID=A0A9W8EET6_9FUNG|nr:hypothetical protein H4R34_001623 [Dimargaris verticillata]
MPSTRSMAQQGPTIGSRVRKRRDPIAADSNRILAELNQRYGSTLNQLCVYFGEAQSPREATLTDIDTNGFAISYTEQPRPLSDDTDLADDAGGEPGSREVRVVFRHPVQSEDDIPLYFAELFDEARTGIVSQTMSQVPKRKQLAFCPPPLALGSAIVLGLALVVYLNFAKKPVYPLDWLQAAIGKKTLYLIMVLAMMAHVFEALLAAMTCIAIMILAPNYLTKSVAMQYVLGTLTFGYPVLRRLLHTVKYAFQDDA